MTKMKEETLKFAAIDIGSNAVRLLLARVYPTDQGPFFKKESLVRMPLRLGEEAFSEHRISRSTEAALIKTMIGFRYMIDAYDPLSSMACATSAMREVENGEDIVERIRETSGIDLQIIDGAREAEIISANHFEERLDEKKAHFYIDVGGGSTELTFFYQGKVRASRSFNIGTVRLLKGLVPQKRWASMKKWVKKQAKPIQPVTGIGSGGNINKIFRLAARKKVQSLDYQTLREIAKVLKSMTFKERITRLNLRSDRADVIVPASRIYLSAMKWAKVKKIYVPQIGLADGIVHLLYEKFAAERNL